MIFSGSRARLMVASLCFLFERAGSSVEVDSIAFVAFVAIDDIDRVYDK